MNPMRANPPIPTSALHGAFPERMIALSGLPPEGAIQDAQA